MKHLQQEKYEDENGLPVEAAKIDCLAPYTYVADGFYNWACGLCGAEHSSRWITVSGRAHKCETCGKLNLLVRTDCNEIKEALEGKWRAPERDKELERLKRIEVLNTDKLAQLRYKILAEVGRMIDKIIKEENDPESTKIETTAS